MNYKDFQRRVKNLVHNADARLHVQFFCDDFRYTARVSDGTTIIANATSPCVTVKWGSGHTATATI